MNRFVLTFLLICISITGFSQIKPVSLSYSTVSENLVISDSLFYIPSSNKEISIEEIFSEQFYSIQDHGQYLTYGIYQLNESLDLKELSSGWFIIDLFCEEDLNKVSLQISQNGSSKIYLDGEFIHEFGENSENGRQDYDPKLQPIRFPNLGSGTHRIAIQYWQENHLERYAFNTRFQTSIPDVIPFIQIGTEQSTIDYLVNFLLFHGIFFGPMAGLFFGLTFVHIILFYFYRMDRSNLFYSFFCISVAILFGLAAYEPFINKSSFIFNPSLLTGGIFLSIYISLLALVNQIFLRRISYPFYIVFFFSIVGMFFYHFNPLIGGIILSLVILGIIEEFGRLIYYGIKNKQQGANIMAYGVVIFVLSLIIFSAIIQTVDFHLDTHTPIGKTTVIIGSIIFLSVPLSTSVYLARQFAYINISLKKQLELHRSFNQRKIAQEQQKKREVEQERNKLQAEYLRKSGELRFAKRELEQKSLIVEQTQNLVIVFNSKGNVEWQNNSFTRNMGYNPDETKGTDAGFILHNSDKFESLSDAVKHIVFTGQPYRYECKLVTKAGKHNWYLASLTPLISSNSLIENVVCVMSDISQKIAYEDQLRQAKDRAEQSEKFKDQFLANMSHEIRTPLNAILGITDLMLSMSELNEKQYNYLKNIKTSGKNLSVIINDILDFSKIEANKLTIEETEFNLEEIVENIYQTLHFKALDKGIEFHFNIEEDLNIHRIGDPVRVSQIILNLTDNAIKFTEKGKVNIKITSGDTKMIGKNEIHPIKISVSDTGIGIPKDKLNFVFEGFSQATADTTRKFGGSGLGLSISKRLAERMNGTIDVNSIVGIGTTFSVTLPLAENTNTSTESKEEEELELFEFPNPFKLLLVEDNEFNQLVAKDILNRDIPNIELTVVDNGEKAVQAVSDQYFDVVLMDIQMPIMDGITATKNIRALQEESKRTVPIIAMTAHVFKDEIDRCYKMGMNGFVPKPFDPQELKSELKKVVIKHH